MWSKPGIRRERFVIRNQANKPVLRCKTFHSHLEKRSSSNRHQTPRTISIKRFVVMYTAISFESFSQYLLCRHDFANVFAYLWRNNHVELARLLQRDRLIFWPRRRYCDRAHVGENSSAENTVRRTLYAPRMRVMQVRFNIDLLPCWKL